VKITIYRYPQCIIPDVLQLLSLFWAQTDKEGSSSVKHKSCGFCSGDYTLNLDDGLVCHDSRSSWPLPSPYFEIFGAQFSSHFHPSHTTSAVDSASFKNMLI
jgi:hypothetical protein